MSLQGVLQSSFADGLCIDLKVVVLAHILLWKIILAPIVEVLYLRCCHHLVMILPFIVVTVVGWLPLPTRIVHITVSQWLSIYIWLDRLVLVALDLSYHSCEWHLPKLAQLGLTISLVVPTIMKLQELVPFLSIHLLTAHSFIKTMICNTPLR